MREYLTYYGGYLSHQTARWYLDKKHYFQAVARPNDKGSWDLWQTFKLAGGRVSTRLSNAGLFKNPQAAIQKAQDRLLLYLKNDSGEGRGNRN